MNNPKPRAYTEDEVRDRFLDHVRGLINYWDGVPGKTKHEAIAGAIFSTLVLLDGGTGLPGFKVTPNPHPEDKAYHIANGDNWYPRDIDIAGCLHELLYQRPS